MKRIEWFDKVMSGEAGVKDLRKANINPTAYWAYQSSLEVENELIDFCDVIWDDDVEPIVETLKENGIKEFTISTTMCELIKTLVLFEKVGCKMNGLTETKVNHKDWETGKYKRIPAIKMIID